MELRVPDYCIASHYTNEGFRIFILYNLGIVRFAKSLKAILKLL